MLPWLLFVPHFFLSVVLKSVLSNTVLGINAKKCILYEETIVYPTALYGGDTRGARSAERFGNVLEEEFEKFGGNVTNG